MATVLAYGNPYTHEEHRRVCYSQRELPTQKDCAWCGQVRPRLYAYEAGPKLFCNRACWKSYTQ
jgi:hypothetical protein